MPPLTASLLATHAATPIVARPKSLGLIREHQVPVDGFRSSYENEGSELVSRGSVTLASGALWMATLEVRMNSDQGALLTVRRSGPGAELSPSDASIVIPPGEADAFLELLRGVIQQARADGVLDQGIPLTRSRRSRARSAPSDTPASGE
jgi:hypothetical protein